MNHNSIPKSAGLLCTIKRLAVVVVVVSAATAANAQGVIGTWQGSLSTGEIQRIVLKIADAGKGALRGTIMFVDRSPDAFPLLSATYSAPELSVAIAEFSFRGKLSAEGKSIAGTWTQRNQSFPLIFTLATPETRWTYSGPSAVPSMATTADPIFEVSTIKPSPPDAKNWGYSWQTRLFQARNNTVADLINFAWQVRRRQIDGGDSWIDTLHFDITGEPDAPGLPSFDQQRLMLRKLLGDRFRLKVHIEQRDLPVYALVAEKGLPKLERAILAAIIWAFP